MIEPQLIAVLVFLTLWLSHVLLQFYQISLDSYIWLRTGEVNHPAYRSKPAIIVSIHELHGSNMNFIEASPGYYLCHVSAEF